MECRNNRLGQYAGEIDRRILDRVCVKFHVRPADRRSNRWTQPALHPQVWRRRRREDPKPRIELHQVRPELLEECLRKKQLAAP